MVTKINEFAWHQSHEDTTCAVVFTASWCESCHTLLNHLEMDSHTFLNMDVDECADVADEFSITSLPAVIFFKEGEVIETFSNNSSPEDIIDFMRDLIQEG